MKTFLQSVILVAAGLLIRQPILVAFAQQSAPSLAVGSQSAALPPDHSPAAGSLASSTSAGMKPSAGEVATNPGQAVGKGDPALGGERHPLYRITRSDTFDLSFTFSPEFNQNLTVQPDGFVSLKGAGAVLAEGLTLPELQRTITTAYSSFLSDPEITVT